ncbi:hypothetical protein CHH92_15995 [Bacillus sonorensis]|nr:hypothetical protein CHH92_15995 [Bacillus sonorensis]RHJ06219.1 hypothetical protein DW143_20735 [Bacillus sonorensis]TWK73903.1 hypothetical protein CHCC20335_2188 [Bacillus paralicheniformis]
MTPKNLPRCFGRFFAFSRLDEILIKASYNIKRHRRSESVEHQKRGEKKAWEASCWKHGG